MPFSRDLPDSGIKPRSPSLQADSLPSEPLGKPNGLSALGPLAGLSSPPALPLVLLSPHGGEKSLHGAPSPGELCSYSSQVLALPLTWAESPQST